jgi:hypothetical protein
MNVLAPGRTHLNVTTVSEVNVWSPVSRSKLTS